MGSVWYGSLEGGLGTGAIPGRKHLLGIRHTRRDGWRVPDGAGMGGMPRGRYSTCEQRATV